MIQHLINECVEGGFIGLGIVVLILTVPLFFIFIFPVICIGVCFYYFPVITTIIMTLMIMSVVLEVYARREGTALWVQRFSTKVQNFMND